MAPRKPQPRKPFMVTEKPPWHVDRSVSLGTILALLLQTIVVSYFIGGLENRVTNIEHTHVLKEDTARLEERIQGNSSNIAALDARTVKGLDEIKTILRDIERKLDESPSKAK